MLEAQNTLMSILNPTVLTCGDSITSKSDGKEVFVRV